ncbi:MAG: hypothetical protein JST04_14610 [Bdellovibrionales bacterium]|nr:hypothetical protein [Bdellovibrionales bacterium]
MKYAVWALIFSSSIGTQFAKADFIVGRDDGLISVVDPGNGKVHGLVAAEEKATLWWTTADTKITGAYTLKKDSRFYVVDPKTGKVRVVTWNLPGPNEVDPRSYDAK